jgi:hypothetical protein
MVIIVIKNWIRFVSFWIIFIFLFSLLNTAMKVDGPRWADFYKLPPNSLDVLFMGNSHNYKSFQPQIIDQILPIHSYTIGIGYEDIFVSYYELKEVLRYQHPKVVVLETYALDLNDRKDKGYIFDFLDVGKWDENKSAIAFRYLFPDKPYAVFPSLRMGVAWNDPNISFNKITQLFSTVNSTSIDPRLGSEINSEVMANDNYVANNKLKVPKYKEPDPEVQIYLEKFYQLCQENNIQLILTTAPRLKISETILSYYAPFDASKFASDNHIDLVTFDTAKFNHLHFSDQSHVNSFGSIITSLEIAREISRKMNLPIDQVKLNYYQSFTFSDYTLVHTGNDYKITLIPTDQNAPLEYKWSIRDVDNNVIGGSDWQNEDSFGFLINKPGDYSLIVDIRNPSGDFILHAGFSLTKSD